eukprot:6276272-Karenia_brevis.AAC.1
MMGRCGRPASQGLGQVWPSPTLFFPKHYWATWPHVAQDLDIPHPGQPSPILLRPTLPEPT